MYMLQDIVILSACSPVLHHHIEKGDEQDYLPDESFWKSYISDQTILSPIILWSFYNEKTF